MVGPCVGLGSPIAAEFLLNFLLWLFVILHLESAAVPGDFAVWTWWGGAGKYFAFAPAVIAATAVSHWGVDFIVHPPELKPWEWERRPGGAIRALCIVATFTLTLALGACGSKPPPTDKAMSDAFFAKRQAFEALKTDLCKLKYDQTITRDWAQPQMPLADETILRERMTALGAHSLHYVRGCQLWIEMWSSGIGRDASYKKYRFGPPMFRIIEIKETPPKDLNSYLDKRVVIASFEKNLTGDWWIELDHWQ